MEVFTRRPAAKAKATHRDQYALRIHVSFNSLPSISQRLPGHCGNYGEKSHLKTLVVQTGALSLTSTTVIVIVVSAEFAGVSTSLTRKLRLKSNFMVTLMVHSHCLSPGDRNQDRKKWVL